jgi:SAM-dependent methyltransferase
LNHKFDLITCILDSTNYILSEEDLENYFKSVYKHLKDNGLFIFDINSYYKLTEILGNNTYNFDNEEDWKKSFAKIFKHCIDINYNQVPEKDYDFWVVAFHNDKDETIFRKDADKSEINRMLNDPDKYCKIWRDFQTSHTPKYWVVWPHSESKGWCDKITGQLN